MFLRHVFGNRASKVTNSLKKTGNWPFFMLKLELWRHSGQEKTTKAGNISKNHLIDDYFYTSHYIQPRFCLKTLLKAIEV